MTDDTPPEHHNAGGTEDWTRFWLPTAQYVAAWLLSVAAVAGVLRLLGCSGG